MDIAILGTGRVGGALGSRWAQKGHQIIYGVRDPNSDEVQSVLEKSGPNASVASVSDAAAAGKVILLAIPWDVTKEVLEAIAAGNGPQNYLVALGYAGWGEGQLDAEMQQNSWLNCPADAQVLFDTPLAERVGAAAKSLGIDFNLISGHAGHA